MKLIIDISEHNKNIISRYVSGEGFERLPDSIVTDVAEAIANSEPYEDMTYTKFTPDLWI